MNKLLLVIDVQRDFVNEYTKEFIEKIKRLTESNRFEYIAFTKFINDEQSSWYKELNYKGCLTKEEQEIILDTKNHKVFEKKIYSSSSEDLKSYLKTNKIEEVYLCGFNTDACILKTALDLFENNIKVYVLKDYCMTTAGKIVHNNALDILKRLIGNNKII